MATLAKSGNPTPSTISPGNEHSLTGLLAGEAIAAGDSVYIKASDGRVWRSNGTSANAAAKCVGLAPKQADAGRPVSIFRGISFAYGSGLTPGTPLYVSATAGALDDAATTGGTAPVGFVVDATRIYIHGSTY